VERIVINRSATLYKTFYEGGVATDPTGTPTVAVTRLSDGSTVTTGSVVNEAAAGTWSVTISAVVNTLLDTLTVTWTGVVNGIAQKYVDVVEVAGDTLFTLVEAKAIKLGAGTDTLGARYTDDQIADMRTSVEQAIEDEYGAALVPRYEKETLNGSPSYDTILRLKWPALRTVRTATVGGTSVLASVEIDTVLGAYYSNGWTPGRSNVVIGYEHGLDRPPERVKRGGLLLLKRWLVEGPVDDRATAMSNDQTTWSLATPGRAGSIFGLPELDAAIQASPYRVGIA
jgi:hypothetical protein